MSELKQQELLDYAKSLVLAVVCENDIDRSKALVYLLARGVLHDNPADELANRVMVELGIVD
jgi:hypothetical protein